jgi:hypothetical protein
MYVCTSLRQPDIDMKTQGVPFVNDIHSCSTLHICVRVLKGKDFLKKPSISPNYESFRSNLSLGMLVNWDSDSIFGDDK